MINRTSKVVTTHLPATRTIVATASVLAVLSLFATSGCQTLTSKPSKDVASNAPPKPDPVDPSAPKTDFRKEVGVEQQYNVHVEMAKVYESQSNFESAMSEYQKASELAHLKGSFLSAKALGPSQEALAERKLAAALDRLGRFTQAETHYGKALKLSPNDAKIWNDAGYSYYLQNRWADAERSLKMADTLDPKNSRVLTNLGLTYAAQGKNDEALLAFSHAGGPAIGHANLGYILAAMGKHEKAREYYQKALDLQPELNPARHAIAKLDLDTKARDNSAMLASATPPVAAPAPAPPLVPVTVPASVSPSLVFTPVQPPKPSILPVLVPPNLAEVSGVNAPKTAVDPRIHRSTSPVPAALEIKPALIDKPRRAVAKPAKDDYLPPLPAD